jgi:Flp pilus assembly protein TadB
LLCEACGADFAEKWREAERELEAERKVERKAEREAQGKGWWVNAFFWACLAAAALFGLLGHLWHPLWVVAGVLALPSSSFGRSAGSG